MHEMSLAGGILRVVELAHAREPFARVSVLRLQAGALAGVELSALRFALDVISRGTLLDGATIEVDETPGRAFCMGCGESVEIRSRTDDCPRCGSARLKPTGGTELKVVDLVVHDD
jgi:hydrogenase nickel incorporation protein HypA/HybF